MGWLGAMKARSFSKDRYFQGDVEDVDKLVPEGMEGRGADTAPVPKVLTARLGARPHAARPHRPAAAARRARPVDGLLRRADDGRDEEPHAVRAHHRRRPPREPPAR